MPAFAGESGTTTGRNDECRARHIECRSLRSPSCVFASSFDIPRSTFLIRADSLRAKSDSRSRQVSHGLHPAVRQTGQAGEPSQRHVHQMSEQMRPTAVGLSVMIDTTDKSSVEVASWDCSGVGHGNGVRRTFVRFCSSATFWNDRPPREGCRAKGRLGWIDRFRLELVCRRGLCREVGIVLSLWKTPCTDDVVQLNLLFAKICLVKEDHAISWLLFNRCFSSIIFGTNSSAGISGFTSSSSCGIKYSGRCKTRGGRGQARGRRCQT